MTFIWQSSRDGKSARAIGSALLALVLSACGGGERSEPTAASTDPAQEVAPTHESAPVASTSQHGPILGKSEPIVVRFSASVDPVTLRLDGALASQATIQWSRTERDNDTLTLSPHGGSWISGDSQDLSVDASSAAGSRSNTLKLSYLVKLVFDNFAMASVVIGQPDFVSREYNQGGTPGANTLTRQYGAPLVTANGMLFLGDFENNRILGFHALPTVNNAAADFVLGQPDFSTDAYSVSQTAQPLPMNAVEYQGRFAVANFGAGRVLIYDAVPTDGLAVPSTVLGEPDFVSSGGACSDTGLDGPRSMATTPDGRLIVVDFFHSRVLIWNQWPAPGTSPPPDLVIGQSDFIHCTANDDNQDETVDAAPSARTLQYPSGVWSDGVRLIVADTDNNRVLVWNTFPTSNFQPADLVLGQGDFTHVTANDDNQDGASDAQPTARTFHNPYDGLASNGVQFAVADSANHRVLIWNSFPTFSFQPADIVLGQSTFSNAAYNDDNQDGAPGSPSARTLFYPVGVTFHGSKLLVSESNNFRVSIFDSK